MIRKTPIAAFFACLIAANAASLMTHPARAAAIEFSPGLPGWTAVKFPFISAAKFTGSPDGALNIATDSAAGMLWRPFDEPMRAPRAAKWRWRVDEGVAATDLTKRGADDRAVSIYFVFNQRPGAQAGPMDTLASPDVTTVVYVFGGDRPRGSLLNSPHMKDRGKFIVLRPATTQKRVWHEETVELAADYTRAFGRAMPALIGIAISSDSDDTGARNRVTLQDLMVN